MHLNIGLIEVNFTGCMNLVPTFFRHGKVLDHGMHHAHSSHEESFIALPRLTIGVLIQSHHI
jgi:hypothetical protein